VLILDLFPSGYGLQDIGPSFWACSSVAAYATEDDIADLWRKCDSFQGFRFVSLFDLGIARNRIYQYPSPAIPTFAHVLHNNGFSRPEYLHSLGDAWRNILDSVEPDLIVFDHAPTVLLTARTCLAKKVVIGAGFCCPPDISPWPHLRIWLPNAPEQLAADEKLVLAHANTVLFRHVSAVGVCVGAESGVDGIDELD